MRTVHHKWHIIALLVCTGVLVQVWAVAQGEANFNSDEAIMGLMTLHILEGRIPIYFYGQSYGGSLEPLLAAGFIHVFGRGIWQLRAPNVILFACFLAANLLLLQRTWGKRLSFLAVLLLALPSWAVLMWLYRPILGLTPMLAAGTAIFLLSELRLSSRVLHTGRLALIGFLFGVALWANPMMVVYAASWAIVYGLSSLEWKTLYGKLDHGLSQVGIPTPAAMLLLVISIAGLGVLAFFSDGCQPAGFFASAARLAELTLVALALPVGLALLWVSKQRRTLISGAASVTCGGLVGSFPQLYARWAQGIQPNMALWPSCPTEAPARGELLLLTLLPSLAGTRQSLIHLLRDPLPIALLSLGTVIITGCALLSFFRHHRRSVARLLTLSPTSPEEQKIQMLILWLGLPIALALVGSNTIDRLAVRFLLITWQAGMIILAWFIDRMLQQQRKVLSLAVLVLWLPQILVVGYGHLQQRWAHKPAAQERIEQIETYLAQNQVSGGYADYWIAYTLDYLTQERLTLAPYNFERYPPYTESVQTLERHAYIIPLKAVSDSDTQLEALSEYMRRNVGAGPAKSSITEHLMRQTLIDRQRIGNWDVWLVTNQQ